VKRFWLYVVAGILGLTIGAAIASQAYAGQPNLRGATFSCTK
jgi:hypothetical protein